MTCIWAEAKRSCATKCSVCQQQQGLLKGPGAMLASAWDLGTCGSWQTLPQTLPLLASGRPTAPACRGATSVATGSSTRSSRLQLKTGSRGMRACTAGGMSIARMTAARAWICPANGRPGGRRGSKFTSQGIPSRYGHPNGQCPFRLALEPYDGYGKCQCPIRVLIDDN